MYWHTEYFTNHKINGKITPNIILPTIEKLVRLGFVLLQARYYYQKTGCSPDKKGNKMDKVLGEKKSGRIAIWFKIHWTIRARLNLAQTTQDSQVLQKLAKNKNSQVRFHAAMNARCHWIDVAIALSKMPKDFHEKKERRAISEDCGVVEEDCYVVGGKNMRTYSVSRWECIEYSSDNDERSDGYITAIKQIMNVHKDYLLLIVAYLADLNLELHKLIRSLQEIGHL